jgi:hypothetical protein
METTGYSGTPLARKLGIGDGATVWFHRVPDYYKTLFDTLPPDLQHARKNCDFIHAFYDTRADLEAEAGDLLAAIRRDGVIWISWPKKAAKMPTDMTEDVVRTVMLPFGLVDVKVCAVDTVWSGLKLVIRKELR